jgi:tetratricopeptide (TPR) repeat protein
MSFQPLRNRRRIRSLLPGICLLAVMLLQACALPPPVKREPVVKKDPFDLFPEAYRIKAVQYEKQKDLGMALFSWQIVKDFRPGDHEASDNIVQLQEEMNAEAEKNYREGISFYEEKKLQEARDSFLKTLAYNPTHKGALEFLRNKLPPPEQLIYHVRNGDDNETIARKVYHDKRFSILVAYFSDSDKGNSLEPGMTLMLPIMEPSSKPKEVHPEDRLEKAQALYEWKRYREAISLSEDIIASRPSKAARTIIDGSYYALAVSEFRKGHLIMSLDLFRMVPKTFRDTGSYMTEIEKKLAGKAETHYKKGMDYFLKEELGKAIEEWEATLRMNPDHAQAKSYLDKARAMMKNLQKLQ